MPVQPPSPTEAALLANLRAFVAFARRRVGDAQLAEDVVQDSLLKALAATRKPAGAEDTVTWFYRILRRAIIDVHRRRGARGRALERLTAHLSEAPTPADERVLCRCFERLLPALPERQRELLQAIDLGGADPAAVAAAQGVTRSHLAVRLHRARRQLRAALARNCRVCSRHGCLDCNCGD